MKHISFIILSLVFITGCFNHKNETIHSIEKQKFIWDFNSEKNYIYSFEQDMETLNGDDIDKNFEDVDTTRVIGKGDLKIKSKGNDKADFVLELSIKNNPFDSLSEKWPTQTMVIQDMDARGGFEGRKRDTDAMFDLIFPLPSRDLEIGESEELDVEIPINLMNSPLYLKGYNKLTYVKDITPTTALIKSEFKVNQLDIPDEIKAEVYCLFSGNAQFEFNYKEGYLESSKVELYIKMKSDFDEPTDEIVKLLRTDMESRSKYEIKFIEIEQPAN